MMYFLNFITDLPIAELRAMEQQMQKGELCIRWRPSGCWLGEIIARFHSAAAAQEREAEAESLIEVFKENQIPDGIPEFLLTPGET